MNQDATHDDDRQVKLEIENAMKMAGFIMNFYNFKARSRSLVARSSRISAGICIFYSFRMQFNTGL